ncbi:hypothetical protein [[Clostridium] polysaccharolyticum]|uniref:Uncharacterized protein n=1 Tax=[Clostridium] polysaccharolyticum TaxID=29364 RepID=A0A1H9ZT53_9FIRM|nr:hypothetical protein [[Clostridium] polysaccharolyticum]SES84892.1 hypothetical protein SAMN04487772_104109 [[Clostridium] polysaccharolyticum]
MGNEDKNLENTGSLDANTESIQKIMEKAITDESFKKRLVESPDMVLDEYGVSGIARIMIRSLSEEDYDKLTPENIAEYFAAESAVYTPDIDDSMPIEYYDEDDL